MEKFINEELFSTDTAVLIGSLASAEANAAFVTNLFKTEEGTLFLHLLAISNGTDVIHEEISSENEEFYREFLQAETGELIEFLVEKHTEDPTSIPIIFMVNSEFSVDRVLRSPGINPLFPYIVSLLCNNKIARKNQERMNSI